jgi:hypothetical protein
MKIDINEYADGAVLLDGFDEAIIGISEEFGNEPRIIYNKCKMLEILESMGMTTEEAIEYYEFNILGLYVSNQNPIFLDIKLNPKKRNDTWEFYSKP